MTTLIFTYDATPHQIEAVRRAIVGEGAAEITRMNGDRVAFLVDDPAGLVHFDRMQQMPGVESVLNASDKNRAVAEVTPATRLESGIEGLLVIAGPCSIESEEQVASVYERMAEEGLRYVRGGAYKPRTSPHDFQGRGAEALVISAEIARDFGLEIVSEVMDPRDVELAARHVAMLQIGTRSMQNIPLLREAGASRLPVLLKRGMSATVEEWIGAAEHVLVAGAPVVIFCERGIRTFESITRNTLDVLGAAALKERTAMPVIVDPSHAAGRRSLVVQGALAGLAAGLDGLLVEVHNDPASARSDAAQALRFDEFSTLMRRARALRAALAEADLYERKR